MSKYDKNITKRSQTTSKTYTYERNSVSLSFTLGSKQEHKDFLELLKVAATEVSDEIKKL